MSHPDQRFPVYLLVPEHGELKVPQAPGLGADPDQDMVRRYRVE